jgi:hypothetical protein
MPLRGPFDQLVDSLSAAVRYLRQLTSLSPLVVMPARNASSRLVTVDARSLLHVGCTTLGQER